METRRCLWWLFGSSVTRFDEISLLWLILKAFLGHCWHKFEHYQWEPRLPHLNCSRVFSDKILMFVHRGLQTCCCYYYCWCCCHRFCGCKYCGSTTKNMFAFASHTKSWYSQAAVILYFGECHQCVFAIYFIQCNTRLSYWWPKSEPILMKQNIGRAIQYNDRDSMIRNPQRNWTL